MQAAILALFAANAVILAVMALAFFAAWLGRRQERYWLSWIVANLVLFASMVCFTLLPVDPAAAPERRISAEPDACDDLVVLVAR